MCPEFFLTYNNGIYCHLLRTIGSVVKALDCGDELISQVVPHSIVCDELFVLMRC